MPSLTRSNIGAPPPSVPELPHGGDGGDGGDDRDRPPRGSSRQASITGILVLMCASSMTFAALVSAMVVRRGLNSDWRHFELPHILWWNTAVLILSSVAFDIGRRLLRKNRRRAFNICWSIGTCLGAAFLAGQIVAWSQLAERGVFIQGNPNSAFFHVLTWSHAAHVVGALIAVLYVEFRALRYELGPGRRTFVDVTAIFWHFLDVMWLGLMGIFVYWA